MKIVANPEISRKLSEKIRRNSRKSTKFQETVTVSYKENASIIAYHVRAGNPAAIKEFQTWADCGTMAAKECIDRVRDSKAQSAARFTY